MGLVEAAYLASFPSRPQSDRTILTIRRLPSKTPHACNSVSILRLDRLENAKTVGMAAAAMGMITTRVYIYIIYIYVYQVEE